MVTRTDATQPIWAFAEHEHQDLRRGINRIHDVACEVGQRPTPELSVDVISVLTWIHDMLEPHIAWEDGWLYPEIEARLGTPWATRAARFDHQQIRQMAEYLTDDEIRLGNPQAGGGQAETRCHLFSLEALLRAHLEREERFLIPILAETASASVEASARPGS